MPREAKPKIRPPRYDVKVSMHGPFWMDLDEEEAIIAYFAPRIEKMIRKDYLKWLPKDFITEDEWKVRWRGVDDIQERVEECIDKMPSWKPRWAYESGLAESLLMLAKKHPDEFGEILAKNFYMRIAHREWS